MKPEIIVIDGTTDDDDENTPPNVGQVQTAAAHGRATGAEASAKNRPERDDEPTPGVATGGVTDHAAVASTGESVETELAVGMGSGDDLQPSPEESVPMPPSSPEESVPMPPSSPEESMPMSPPSPGSPAGIPFSTNFSIPNSRRDSARGLKQLQLVRPPTPAPKKRRADMSAANSAAVSPNGGRTGFRQTRLATMLVRPMFRPGRLLVERTLARPPPLRSTKAMQPVRMSTHTHVMDGVGEESLVPARWPRGVVPLGDHYNKDDIRFQHLPTKTMCNCVHHCRVDTCANAKSYIFCDVYSCPFSGLCGNGLEPSRFLALMKNTSTKQFTVAAANPIDGQVVVGEYLGKMKLESMPASDRPKNTGYRFYMHHDPDHDEGARVCIDAQKYGSLIRFVNHSCFPNCRFRQVHNGTEHTIVLVTNRRLARGEELLVDYGDTLWFLCRCGVKTCRHQGLPGDENDADDEMGDHFDHEEKSAACGESDVAVDANEDSDDFE